jgi:hypothetical protein
MALINFGDQLSKGIDMCGCLRAMVLAEPDLELEAAGEIGTTV